MPADRRVIRRVARNVRLYRNMMGISVWEAAEQAGLSPETWRKIETGQSNIGIKTLAKVCLGLSVDVTELFTFQPPPRRS